MKIAFLTPEYPHSRTGASGGIGTSIKNLATGLLAKGCSVLILVYGQQQEDVFDDNGIRIQQIRNVKLKGLSWYLTRKKIQQIINKLYEANEIDLVEAPDWTGITSFVSPKKCPIVIRLNGSDTYFCHLDNRPVKWINKFHEKRALQKADGLLSVSQFTADMTNTVFGLEKKFSIIPNSINIDLFSKNIYDKNVSFSDSLPFGEDWGEDIILYFGTLIRKKGLLELPLIFNKVIERFPTAQLYLVGRDSSDTISGMNSTWEMMQALFTPTALRNVTYFGGVSHAEIQKQIQRATVCVFPSFAEALPVSWLEAMAMEKPIVASNIGWGKEVIIDGECGLLVHPEAHQKYADKIIHLLNDKNAALQMGMNARRRVEQVFDSKKIAADNINFYQKIINS